MYFNVFHKKYILHKIIPRKMIQIIDPFRPITTTTTNSVHNIINTSTEATMQKVSITPDLMPTSTFSSLVSASSVEKVGK